MLAMRWKVLDDTSVEPTTPEPFDKPLELRLGQRRLQQRVVTDGGIIIVATIRGTMLILFQFVSVDMHAVSHTKGLKRDLISVRMFGRKLLDFFTTLLQDC